MISDKKVLYSEYNDLIFIDPVKNNTDKLFLANEYGDIYTADTTLSLSIYHKFSNNKHVYNMYKTGLWDVDGDSEIERLSCSKRHLPNKLIITREDLKERTIVDLPEIKPFFNSHVSLKRVSENSKPIIVLQTGDIIYYIKYGKSKYFILKYPAYFAIYLLIFIILFVLQKIQNNYATKKYNIERQLLKQQLAISKNQLEPHFMLNTLNSIGYMFANEDKREAQFYFGKYASLIHRGLKYADKVETSLEEEIQFIKDYLILQRRRFNDELTYNIEIEKEIEIRDVRIPHSLVFTFVENAIKHGLRAKLSERQLDVFVRKDNNRVVILIKDNGIGRLKAKSLNIETTGKGLNIITTIITSYNKLYSRSISYKVKDMYDDKGIGKGTEVEVVI